MEVKEQPTAVPTIPGPRRTGVAVLLSRFFGELPQESGIDVPQAASHNSPGISLTPSSGCEEVD